VLRHSQANQCLILLSTKGDLCLLQIKDNGIGVGKTNRYIPGNGITGMTERVKALGGQLNYGQPTSGFSVSVKLPLDRSL